MKSELRQDEQIIKSGFANLQKNFELVGGRLYLTSQRLVFEAHWLNLQSGVNEIELCDLVSLRKCWTRLLGVIPVFPNSLAIHTKWGEEYRFVISRRDSWTDAIETQKRNVSSMT